MKIQQLIIGLTLIASLAAAEGTNKNLQQNSSQKQQEEAAEILALEKKLHNFKRANALLKKKFKKYRRTLWKNFLDNKEITKQASELIFSDIPEQELIKVDNSVSKKDRLIEQINVSQRIVNENQDAYTKMKNLLIQAETVTNASLNTNKDIPTEKKDAPAAAPQPNPEKLVTDKQKTPPNDAEKPKTGAEDTSKKDPVTASLPWSTQLSNLIYEHKVISAITGIATISGIGYAVYNWYNKKYNKQPKEEKEDTTFDDFINEVEN